MSKIETGECDRCHYGAILYPLFNKVTKKWFKFCYGCRDWVKREVKNADK